MDTAFTDGLIALFMREYQDDLRHGKGRFLWSTGRVTKETTSRMKNRKRSLNGLTVLSMKNFLAGKRHGLGTYKSANGTIYEGEWFDDLQHGHGTLIKPDGTTIKEFGEKELCPNLPYAHPPLLNLSYQLCNSKRFHRKTLFFNTAKQKHKRNFASS